MLDPYFTATKITWLLRHGALALGPDPPTSPSERSTPGCCGI